ncbi:MAG: Non-motile and phage-resistance protein [Actinobacteria bacterium ADurb.Bin444]|nr:MAG: Non-motile and phage-resistance protein [Actinobacteria bacterium ADurb.Bin444]
MKKFAAKPSTPYLQVGDFVIARTLLTLPLVGTLLVLALATRDPLAWWVTGVGGVVALSNIPVALWTRASPKGRGVWPAVVADALFVLLIVQVTGGPGSAVAVLLLWPALAASMLLGPGPTYAVALAEVALFAGLAYLAQRGVAVADLPASLGVSVAGGWAAVAVIALGLMVIAYAAGLLAGGLVTANARLGESLAVERARVAVQQEINRRFLVLEETGAILSRLQDLETILPQALGKLASYVGVGAGFIALFAPGATEGAVAARLGIDDSSCRMLLGGRLPNRVDAIERAAFEPPVLGFLSYLAAPLRLGEEYLGTVYLLSRPAQRVQRGAEELLDAIGGQLAIAVRNVQFTQELAAANEELLHVDRLKSDFLATMSHELRTPLTSIVGYTDMLISGLAGEVSDKQRALLRSVLNSSDTLLNLINDLLDLTKVEAGKMDLSLEPVDLKAVVGDVLSVVGPKAREKNIKVSSLLPGALPPLLADASRLEQVLMNLVTNAVKFTPEFGSVTIEGRPLSTGFVEVRVSDTGIGIRAEDFDRIFERFSQIDNTSTRAQGGTGLGLAITRDLIHLHGGTITVQSQAGKGSVFVFTIPHILGPHGTGPTHTQQRRHDGADSCS